MKISCTQENLNQGLSVVSHIAVKNNNLPILANILFKVEDKMLTLSATNLEIGISIKVRGKVEEDGEFTAEARLVSDYISLLPKERIDLETSADNLKIGCQKQKTKIKTQSGTDFPLIPKIEKNNAYVVSNKEFKDAISEVSFAASNSETRPEIAGVFMNFVGGELIVAATDSYRLAEKKIKLVESAEEERKIIVPVKTLLEVSRILGIFKEDITLGDNDNLEIYIADNQIMFSYNGAEIISRLIEGQYPDYAQIIPTSTTSTVRVGVSELTKAVKTASLFTKSGIFDIKLEFNPSAGELVLSSSSAQAGENISSVEAEITGNASSIVLNFRYLLDGLQNIKSEKAVLELNDINSPGVLRPDNDERYVYIVMPIKQ